MKTAASVLRLIALIIEPVSMISMPGPCGSPARNSLPPTTAPLEEFAIIQPHQIV